MTATPPLDPTVEAFRGVIADPAFAGRATITGSFTLEGSTAPPEEITGSTSWHGPDAAQDLGIDDPTPTTMFAGFGRRASTIEVEGQRYVLMCGDSTCRPSQGGLWSAVRESTPGRPAPGPLSIIALLRSRADFRHAGSEVVDGRTLERLVTTEAIDEESAFGRVGSFGSPVIAVLAIVSGRLEVLVDADGRPVTIRAALALKGSLSTAPKALVNLELAVEQDAGVTVKAPPASRVIRITSSPNGYSLPVLADWTLTSGDTVDRWVSPDGATKRELRVHLEMLDAAAFDQVWSGESLTAWVLETYGVSTSGTQGGFGGAVNSNSTTFDARIGGRLVTVTVGALFWGGPGTCQAGDVACTNRWSVIEIYTEPPTEDVVAGNLSYVLINLAAALFEETT